MVPAQGSSRVVGFGGLVVVCPICQFVTTNFSSFRGKFALEIVSQKMKMASGRQRESAVARLLV